MCQLLTFAPANLFFPERLKWFNCSQLYCWALSGFSPDCNPPSAKDETTERGEVIDVKEKAAVKQVEYI